MTWRPALPKGLKIPSMRSVKTITFSLLALAAFSRVSPAQSFDSSGDGLLNGTYYMRQVFYITTATSSDVANIQGTITFNGAGAYTFSGSLVDFNNGTQPALTASGTYSIAASGQGFISAINPQVFSGDQIYGMVANGIFIGSSTENTEGYNDLFIAAPVGATQATNATLNGTYQVAYIDPSVPGDALFALNANGQGNVGTVNVTSYLGSNTTATTQTLTGVTYTFTNGAAQIAFGGNTSKDLISGTSLLYVSPDGNFIFGGNYNGFDMFVGVRSASGNPTSYQGLFYQAGLDMSPSNGLDSYYGAINILSNGDMIAHQRQNFGGAFDYTYYDNYTLNGDGSSSDADFAQTYWSSPDGSIRVGFGAGPPLGYDILSLNVALRSPSCATPSNCSATPGAGGVYLDPQGMVNAASSAPFTAQLSPGEFLTLLGTNLAPSPMAATTLPLPPSLNGVQVMINGRQAPIQFVSPGQINVVVPFFTESIAQIQVINNNKSSNTVTQFVGATSAGVFTIPEGGIFDAAALHAADFTLVSDSSPAQAGETVAVYVAGLGTVTPAAQDGAAGLGTAPYNQTVSLPQVYLADSAGNFPQATVSFAGLAPGFAGLYQINFTVPTGLASGLTSIEIVGGPGDSDTFEALLPVGTPTAAATPTARAKAAVTRPLNHRQRLPGKYKFSPGMRKLS